MPGWGMINNPWVVNSMTGLISGIAVFLVTKWLSNRGQQKERRQAIRQANLAVVSWLRPSVAEGVIPPTATVEALLHAAAREHDVELHWLWTPQEIAEELVKEVMESAFLAGADKQAHVQRLAETLMQSPIKAETRDDVEEPRTNPLPAFFLALLGAGIAMLLVNVFDFNLGWSSVLATLFLILGVVGVVVVASAIVFVAISSLSKKEAEANNQESA